LLALCGLAEIRFVEHDPKPTLPATHLHFCHCSPFLLKTTILEGRIVSCKRARNSEKLSFVDIFSVLPYCFNEVASIICRHGKRMTRAENEPRTGKRKMTTAQQMNAARKSVKNAMKSNQDRTHLHQVAIDSLVANGMNACVVTEMAQSAMLDVICGC
jgi:hypothetical protein